MVYRYKADTPFDLPSEEAYVGLIAQDVQKVLPEAVEEREGGYLGIDSDPIYWAMFNAIKDLKAENDALREEIEHIKALIGQKDLAALQE